MDLQSEPGFRNLADRGRGFDIAALMVVLTVALLFRGWHLNRWPIFIDEDQYGTTTRSISDASFFRGFKLASREVDKPVLLFWFREMLWPICGDPVLAGRWVSVGSGVVCCGLCYLLGRRASGSVAGLVAALIYATSPWTVLQDRQNIHDSAMTALVLGSVQMMLRQIDRPTLVNAVVAAVLGGLAVFAKPSAVFLFLTPGIAYLSFGKRPWESRFRGSIGIMSAGPLVTYLILKYGHLGAPTDRLAPFSHAGSNGAAFIAAVRLYLGPGVLLLATIGIAGIRHKNRGSLVLYLLLALGWTAVWIMVGDFAPSRYFLPTVAFCAVLAGAGAQSVVMRLWRRSRVAGAVGILVIAAILTGPLLLSVQLVNHFGTAPMTALDDWQYRRSWAAGYAYHDAAAWIRQHMPPRADVAYLVDVDHLEASGLFDPLPAGCQSVGHFAKAGELTRLNLKYPAFVMISDSRNGKRSVENQVMTEFPGSFEAARFLNIGSRWGVAILEIP